MTKHGQKRVEAIRKKVAAEQKAVARLEEQIKNPAIRKMLKTSRRFLGDVETNFLAKLTEESNEAVVLFGAEHALQLGAHCRKTVQKMFDTYGPGVMLIE